MKKVKQLINKDFRKQLISELKELSEISEIYISKSFVNSNKISNIEKFLSKSGIPILSGYQVCGQIDISDYISNYFDDIEHQGKPINVFTKEMNAFGKPEKVNISGNKGEPNSIELILTEKEEQKIKDFEERNIKAQGPSETTIGEIFRAFRYIEYRAYNDGDIHYAIGSPSFKAYLYILSIFDNINWSKLYEKKDIVFENQLLNFWIDHENHISFEGMLFEIPFLKLILLELVEKEFFKDWENEYESRSFTKLIKSEY